MAIKNIIAKGIGFTSDGTKWLPTHGFSISVAAVTIRHWVEETVNQFGVAWTEEDDVTNANRWVEETPHYGGGWTEE